MEQLHNKLNELNRKRIVDVLNSLEVIEQSGGEDCYILVKNSVENRKRLNDVGVPSVVIDRYGDVDTFCILALAFGEGLADYWMGGLRVYDEIDKELRNRVDKGKGTPQDAILLLNALKTAEEKLNYVNQALNEPIPGTSEEFAAWLHSILPFLNEGDDVEHDAEIN